MQIFLALLLLEMSAMGADLGEIRATQRKLFAERGRHPEVRDATEDVTVLKHQLRDWIDALLAGTGAQVDPSTLRNQLNAGLRNTRLAGPFTPEHSLGEVDDVQVRWTLGATPWLEVTTRIGIDCMHDESLYLYEWAGSAWNRRFQLEQNDYKPGHYNPQYFDHVELSAPNADGERLLLTFSHTWSCASWWQNLHYRLFAIGSNVKTLLDDARWGYLGAERPYAARLEPDGALIEFDSDSLDGAIHNRPAVMHFLRERDQVRRVEPVALRAQDFVEEWLTRPWAEMKTWSTPSLQAWHNQLSSKSFQGEYHFAQPCEYLPGQWQMGVARNGHEYFFLVEEMDAYRYRMLDISEARQPGCPGEQRAKGYGEARPTLFP